jgi:type IV secretion system protein VirB11
MSAATSLPVATQPRDVAAARRTAMLRGLLGSLIGGLIAQDGLTDIEANSDGAVWATFVGRGRERVGTISPEDAEKLIYAVAKAAGEQVGRERPSLSAELEADAGEGGAVLLRFQGSLRPVVRRPGFVIRKPSDRVFTLADYVAAGIMTPAQRGVLLRAALDHLNVLLCGGTGAGKTTLMNAMLDAVADETPEDRIVCSERTRELRCKSRNVEYLRTGPHYTPQQSLQDILRMNPDRIMFGEVRGAEALDMLMAWNTGHDGGFCTIHSKTSAPKPKAALLRLEQACALATAMPLQAMIAETVDLVVCIRKSAASPAGRIVSHIAAVKGWDVGDYALELEAVSP